MPEPIISIEHTISEQVKTIESAKQGDIEFDAPKEQFKTSEQIISQNDKENDDPLVQDNVAIEDPVEQDRAVEDPIPNQDGTQIISKIVFIDENDLKIFISAEIEKLRLDIMTKIASLASTLLVGGPIVSPSTSNSTNIEKSKKEKTLSRLPVKTFDELRLLDYDICHDKDIVEIIVS